MLLSKAATVADAPTEIDPNSDTALSVLIPKKEVAKIVAALRDGQIDIALLGQSGVGTP